MKKPCVLLVDDEPLILSALGGFLKEQPWDVVTASDGKEAVGVLMSQVIDIAVLDLRMPYLDGLVVLKTVKRHNVDTDIVILTAYGSIQRAVLALKNGARDFLPKPIQKAEFLDVVCRLMDKRYPTTHVLAERLDRFVEFEAPNPNLTLTDVQNQFAISKSYTCRLFADSGTSFTACLAHHRVARAKRLLDTTDEPIYVIAELCGFKNSRRMAEVFKRLEGVTPTQYRQNGGLGRIE